MPTYEHVVDGQIVERSTTLAEHPFDAQMAALVGLEGSGWRCVGEPTITPVPEAIPPAAAPTAEVPAQLAPAEPAAAEAPAPSESDSTPVVVGEAGPETTDLPPSTETPAPAPKEQ